MTSIEYIPSHIEQRKAISIYIYIYSIGDIEKAGLLKFSTPRTRSSLHDMYICTWLLYLCACMYKHIYIYIYIYTHIHIALEISKTPDILNSQILKRVFHSIICAYVHGYGIYVHVYRCIYIHYTHSMPRSNNKNHTMDCMVKTNYYIPISVDASRMRNAVVKYFTKPLKSEFLRVVMLKTQFFCDVKQWQLVYSY